MKHRLRDVLGSAMIGAFVSALFVLFWKQIPQANEQIITYMIGQLSGFAATIVAFHYASNAQSQEATANTGKAFDAIAETARAGTGGEQAAAAAADQVAEAAVEEADDIAGRARP